MRVVGVPILLFASFFLRFEAGANPKCSTLPFQPCPEIDIVDQRLQVPLDWFDAKDSRKIEIKYRIIGQNYQDTRPTLYLIGGGPAWESIPNYLRRESMGESGLTAHFRVIVFDQRGVGASSSVDRHSPLLTPELMARYFSSRQIIHDLGQIIKATRPAARPGVSAPPIFAMGHSFGGAILTEYLLHPLSGPRLEGVIYASSFTFLDLLPILKARGEMQKQINQQLLTADHRAMVLRLRARLKKINEGGQRILPDAVDILFQALTPANPEWIDQELRYLDADGRTDDEIITYLESRNLERMISDRFGSVLSAVDMMHGRTEREMLAETTADFSAENWMLLEQRLFMRAAADPGMQRKMGIDFEEQTKQAVARYARPADEAGVRRAFTNLPVLALLGTADTFVPYSQVRAELERVLHQPFHWIEALPEGDHGTSMDIPTADLIAKKMKQLMVLKTLSQCERLLAG